VIALSDRTAKQARRLLNGWRRAIFESHVSKETGMVDDDKVVRELAEFDSVIATLSEAIKKARSK
jgi:hypothetical protein